MLNKTTLLNERPPYESMEDVLNEIGEWICIIQSTKIKIGYTRTLSHPLLLRVTRKVESAEVKEVLETESKEIPALFITSKETKKNL